MEQWMQGLLTVIAEMLCCKMFFESFGRRRDEEHTIKNALIIITLIILEYLVVELLQKNMLVKAIFINLIIAILMWLYLKIRPVKAVVLTMLYYGLVLAIDYLVVLLLLLFWGSASRMDEHYAAGWGLAVVLSRMLLVLSVMLIRQCIGRKYSVPLRERDWLKFLFFPVFSVGIVIAMVNTVGGIENQQTQNIFYVIALGLVGMNFVVFYLMHGIMQREHTIREHEIFRLQVQNQTDAYRTVLENARKQRKRTHEYKNQILCIDSLLRNKQYDKLEEYVAEIGSSIQEEEVFNTNHAIVNAILNTKYREAVSKGILFVPIMNDLAKIPLSDEDVVVILSNLLNNAIEACEKCTDEKWIKVKMMREDDLLVIAVRNTYTGELRREGERIVTMKKQEEEHGIGIDNIIETIEKYDGSYVIQTENQEFFFSIVIPDEEE